MVDYKVTNNFITEREAKKLGLKLEKDVGKLKAFNSQAKENVGLAKQVKVRLGK